jgi:hypothetical protein
VVAARLAAALAAQQQRRRAQRRRLLLATALLLVPGVVLAWLFEATRRRPDPDAAAAGYEEGKALNKAKNYVGAEATLRTALEAGRGASWKMLPHAHYQLGESLFGQGHLDRALACYRYGYSLGHRRSDWDRTATNDKIRKVELLIQLLPLLPATPAWQPDQLNYRFYNATFAGQRPLASQLALGQRYPAACFAVMASFGEDDDGGKLQAAQCRRLRRQALAWLRVELQEWKRKPATAGAREAVRSWEKDRALAGVRSDLHRVTPDERKPWAEFWKQARALKAAALAKTRPER